VKWVLKNINLIILQVVGRIMIYFYFLWRKIFLVLKWIKFVV
jgi:hypothetical protein